MLITKNIIARITAPTTLLTALFMLCSIAGIGATIPISIVGKPTQTQIVINYTATTSAACTISVTDNNGGTNPPRDIDTSLFASANSDLGRTVASGFRWPTIVNGLNRTVFLGGHDEVKKGSDGRFYSSALQVNSDHTISLSCNGGADTGSIHVSTSNLMAGSYYPELVIPTSGAPLGYPQPTVFYGGCGGGDPKCTEVNYIDPITGVLMRRIGSPLDNVGNDHGIQGLGFGTAAIDLNSAWTSPNNIITNQNSATLASTSTQNAPIFAPISPGGFAGYFDSVSDIAAIIYGNASVNGTHVGICLSQDSGNSCSSGEVSQAISTTVGVQATVPSNFPTNYFAGWGTPNGSFAWGNYDNQNRTITGVSVSGSTVTIATPAAPGFNLDRKPGTVFTLTACATGGPLTLHVSTVDTWAQITTQETGNTAANCTYTDLGFGFRLRLIDAGTVNLSLTDEWYQAAVDYGGSNGDNYFCAKSKVTDVTTDCDGVTHSPATSGYLCTFTNGVYLLQDNGRTCLQSNYFWAGGHLKTVGGWVDNKSFIAADYANPQHTWKVAANKAGNYTEYVPSQSVVPDNFTHTDLGTASSVQTAVIAQGGIVGQSLNTGLWGSLSFQTGVDGAAQYNTCQGAFDPYCVYAWTDSNGTLLSSAAPWAVYPFRWNVSHQSPVAFSNLSLFGTGGFSVQYGATTSTPLGGPWLLRVSTVNKNGSATTHTATVSAATNANPAVFTITNGDIDNISGSASREGVYAVCSGGSGSWAAANTTLYLHYVDNNTYSAYTDTTGLTGLNSTTFGAYTANSVSCQLAPSIYTVPISGVPGDGTTNCAGAACARATLNLSHPGFLQYMRSGANPIQDADPVILSGASSANPLNDTIDQTKQYYAKVSGVPAGSVDIYRDAALTVHVPNSELSSALAISYAEVCPDPATVTLPGPLYGDNGWGTTGSLMVRCVTVNATSEPCSDYAAAGEQAKYPCPADPANTAKSSLQNLNVGDGLMQGDDASSFQRHEIFTVLKKNKISENNIQLTLLRWSVDQSGGRGFSNCRTCDYYANIHNYGLVLTPFPLAPLGVVNITNGTYTPLSLFVVAGSIHSDFSMGSTSTNLVRALPYYNQDCCGSPQPDSIPDFPLSQLSTYVGTSTHASDPIWAGDTADNVHSVALAQTYPSFRQIYGQFADTTIANADWMAQQSGNGGNGENNHDGSDWTRTVTKVSGTCCVYKVTAPTAYNIKVDQYLVNDWPHFYYVDKSGPGSTIGDSNIGFYCHALNANECVTGSLAGDTYIATRGLYDPGRCLTNNQTLGTPCVIGLNGGTGWAVQVRIKPMSVAHNVTRRLTMAWTPPLAHWTFHHWISSPDNKWGLMVSNPVNFRPNYQAYQGRFFWQMKLPPWTSTEDSVDRTTFVQTPVKVGSGSTGDTVRIGFGYGENGDPSKLYCTTRAEACYTTTAASTSSPFVFAGETQGWQACDTGCTVNVPAIAGRTLFYQIQRKNSAGVITYGDVTPLPIP